MSHSRSRLKIIAIGFNIYGTGLTRVMHSIMRRLADRHEIHYLGIGYSGETIRDQGLTIHPTNLKGGDVFAAFQAKRLIEEIDPDARFYSARHLDASTIIFASLALIVIG